MMDYRNTTSEIHKSGIDTAITPLIVFCGDYREP